MPRPSSNSSAPQAFRRRERGSRQARGRKGAKTNGENGVLRPPGGDGCSSGGQACVVDAGRAMKQLVQEAMPILMQPQPEPVLEGSPRSAVSEPESGGSAPSGGSYLGRLRDLFASGTFRQDTGDAGDESAGFFQKPEAKLHEKWGDYEYNEDLQEDLFLERVFFPIHVKNTFIHYKCSDDEDALPRSPKWDSSPAQMLAQSWHTKWPAHEEAHYQGRCRPCAYHLYKADGCRLAFDCQFCHLCKRGEIKKRKKEKAGVLRAAREARRAAAIAAGAETASTASAENSSRWNDMTDSDEGEESIKRLGQLQECPDEEFDNQFGKAADEQQAIALGH